MSFVGICFQWGGRAPTESSREGSSVNRPWLRPLSGIRAVVGCALCRIGSKSRTKLFISVNVYFRMLDMFLMLVNLSNYLVYKNAQAREFTDGELSVLTINKHYR